MRKRIVAGRLAVTLLLAALLGGCGGQKAAPADSSTSASQESAAENAGESNGTGTEADGQTKENVSQDPPSEQPAAEEEETEMTEVSYSRVSVHDPSVAYDNGTYYIFGSHMAWAKSTDLRNWETFQMNINAEYADLFGKEWEAYCKTATNPNLNGNLWAPDVIYNPNMGKYCFYMSVNGNDWNSVIVLLTADSIEGPYEYAGPVVYSGFNTDSHDVKLTDVYQVLGEDANLTRYQNIRNTKLNAIDPCVVFDRDGSLWMVFGSWFGGLYMLKLDENTGLRDYTTTYETIANEQDAYYGYKVHGGFGVSGEGPYIIEQDGYYYLFVSYGGLVADGWLVAAPYEYAGEKISENGYAVDEMCGDYEFIVHTPTTYYQKAGSSTLGIMQPSKITLNEDGTVSGELTGAWTYEDGTPNMTITVDGVTYKGVFLKMPSEQLYFNPNERKVVMTFTALGDNVAVWGSR